MLKQANPVPPGFKRLSIKGREVFAPDDFVRELHNHFLNEVPLVRWENQLHTIGRHIDSGNRFFLKVDIASAFDSVRHRELSTAVYKDWGWDTYIPDEYFFHKSGGLIQGAPASPYLFRLYCERSGLDTELAAYCSEQNKLNNKGYVWSRYVDDVIISARNPIGRTVVPRLRSILRKRGFILNDSKTIKRDTKWRPFEALGVRIYNGHVGPTTSFLGCLTDDGGGASIKGKRVWLKQVNQLNYKLED